MLDYFQSLVSQVQLLFPDMPLWTLFLTGFLSATLLPGGSEAILVAVLASGLYSPVLIIFVATVGNSLGGMTNYALGIILPERTHQDKRGHKSVVWLKKYGYWTLLLSWMPVIGDALCVAAGWLRLHFLPSLLFILIGKAVRYVILTILFYGFF